jgi:hypothetical protein
LKQDDEHSEKSYGRGRVNCRRSHVSTGAKWGPIGDYPSRADGAADNPATFGPNDDFVIVNGWVLTREDLNANDFKCYLSSSWPQVVAKCTCGMTRTLAARGKHVLLQTLGLPASLQAAADEVIK